MVLLANVAFTCPSENLAFVKTRSLCKIFKLGEMRFFAFGDRIS